MKLRYNNSLRLLSAFVLLLLVVLPIQAKHLVGGDMTYRCLPNSDDDKFRIEVVLTIYRDGYQVPGERLTPFDLELVLGIFRGNASNWNFEDRQTIDWSAENTRIIPVPRNPCFQDPGDIITDRAIYTTILELDVIDENYHLAYQRCCRNNNVANIRNSGTTGAVISLEITPEAQRSCNSSPVFNRENDILICSGQFVNIDFSASDNDVDALGKPDSLSYKVCSPIANGGVRGSSGCPAGEPLCFERCDGTRPGPERCDPLTFSAVGYTTSRNEPIPGLVLDTESGFLSGSPTTSGLYVIAVCVEEWRGGVQIGEIRRDFQFTITACPPIQPLPGPKGADVDEIKAACDAGDQKIINSCGETEVEIRNYTNARESDITWLWSIEENPGDTLRISDKWQPKVKLGLGRHWVQLVTNPGETCADTCESIIDITPEFEARLEIDEQEECIAKPFNMNGTDSKLPNNDFMFNWDFGDGNKMTGDFSVNRGIARVQHMYDTAGEYDVTLTIVNEECVDSVTETIRYFPLPSDISISPTQFVGCAPAEITFDNLTQPIDDRYEVKWDFGDRGKSEDVSPTHIFEKADLYTVEVEIKPPNNCPSLAKTFNDYINILESPEADFDLFPELVEELDKPVAFTNKSEDAQSFEWDFGDGNTSTDPNPSHTYSEVGDYEVQLVAFQQENFCSDTMRMTVRVFPPLNPIFPNAFTPNGDGRNDLFLGISTIEGFGEYELRVFDRWGQKVFETENIFEGWTGAKFNSGDILPNGVYQYVARFFNVNGEKDLVKGTVLLLN